MTDSSGARPQIQAGGAQSADETGADVNNSAAKPRAISERQENFCQAYIVAGNGTKAAINAGYEPRNARHQASRLLTKANIAGRIAGLRRDLGFRNQIDRDTIMAKFEAAYRGAMTGHMYLTAVRAAEAQARLAGLLPDRVPARARASKREPRAGRAGARASPAGAEKFKGNGAAHSLEPSHERR
jgi:phage terminase small subunit